MDLEELSKHGFINEEQSLENSDIKQKEHEMVQE